MCSRTRAWRWSGWRRRRDDQDGRLRAGGGGTTRPGQGPGGGGRSSFAAGCRTPRSVSAPSRRSCSRPRASSQQAISQNEKLTFTLREAREHIAALREEVDKLTQPPVRLRHLPRPQRRRHRRRVRRRAARSAWPCTPSSAPATADQAGRRRWCSTSRSTSCWPARPSSPGEVVTLKECSTTPGPSSSAGPTRSGSSSCTRA